MSASRTVPKRKEKLRKIKEKKRDTGKMNEKKKYRACAPNISSRNRRVPHDLFVCHDLSDAGSGRRSAGVTVFLMFFT